MDVPLASNSLTLLHVGADAAFLGPLAEAVARTFPGATLIAVDEVATALARESAAEELLVVDGLQAADRERVVDAVDSHRLPRWFAAISREGNTPPADELNAIPRHAWTADVLGPVLRAVREQRRLARENARFRGDLMTIGLRVTHDLRTPLGGITTTTEMLREILAEDAPDKAPLTQPILDSMDGLVKLIERVSFLAKAAASREPATRFNMLQPFWNASQQMESALNRAGVSLQQPRDWPVVEAHPAWLQVVWRLLIGNALQHGGPGVRIEAGWTPLADGFRFFVRDSGAGVPLAKRALLFHPFERLHEPAAPRGFGLSTVRRVVELEGGTYGFEALPEGGSLFFFTLPQPKGTAL